MAASSEVQVKAKAAAVSTEHEAAAATSTVQDLWYRPAYTVPRIVLKPGISKKSASMKSCISLTVQAVGSVFQRI